MPTIARHLRWLVPALGLLIWLVGVGPLGQYAGKLGDVQSNDNASFLPASAESTKARKLEEGFSERGVTPLIVLWETTGTGRITTEQSAAADRALEAVRATGATGERISPPIPSTDGRALQAVVPLREGQAEPEELLDTAEKAIGTVPGTTVRLAGPAALQADLSGAFAGIDSVLLLVALGVVLLILLLVYRSLLLPLVVILGAVLALGLASAIVYALADRDVLKLDGQAQGIMFILVVGAATDYALLLAIRFREELSAEADRWKAIRTAWRRSLAPISASALTVVLGLLALLFSDLNSNRSLGPVAAIGIACALVSALTFLPAALALLGRAAYWPSKPKASGGVGAGVWTRLAGIVSARPRRIWVVTALLLTACGALMPTFKAGGLPQTEVFLDPMPSVQGQQAVARHFPAGTGSPAIIIARAETAAQVRSAAERTPGIAAVRPVTAGGPVPDPAAPPKVVDGRVRIDATLTAQPDSDAAQRTIERLRDRVHAVPRAEALVGGYTATQYDTRTTSARDRLVIIPIALAVITLILALLLRALVAPLLLIATVVLSYAATLGVAAVVFDHVFGFGGSNPSVPLFAFVFLVSLGVDYNIFLMTRVREETLEHGTREGVRRGLIATGGVITSAGVVLAATFSALAVIPLVFMVQLAFIVAFGVLLDTLAVRSLLVPALVYDLGDRVWWPGRPAPEQPAEDKAAPSGAPARSGG